MNDATKEQELQAAMAWAKLPDAAFTEEEHAIYDDYDRNYAAIIPRNEDAGMLASSILAAAVRDLQQQNAELREGIKTIDRAHDKVEAENDALESQLAAAQSSLAEAQKRLAEFKANSEEYVIKTDAAMDRAIAQIEKAEAENARLKLRNDYLEPLMPVLEAREAKLVKQLEFARAQLEAKDKELDELMEERDSAENAIDAILKAAGFVNGVHFEWSSEFGYAQAVDLVGAAFRDIRLERDDLRDRLVPNLRVELDKLFTAVEAKDKALADAADVLDSVEKDSAATNHYIGQNGQRIKQVRTALTTIRAALHSHGKQSEGEKTQP